MDTNIKENQKQEVNILLLAMSTLFIPEKECMCYYEDESNKIGPYIGQLEPVPLYLDKIIHLDDIYVLNTDKTENDLINLDGLKKIDSKLAKEDKELTAFKYFEKKCSKYCKRIISINISKTGIESAIYKLSNEITQYTNEENKIVNLYVDIHGGLRNAFSVVDAMIMLIQKMNNVNLKKIYTVDFDKGKGAGIIKDCTEDFDIFKFTSGVNELLNFGRSESLVEYNNSKNETNNSESYYDKLVELSNEISNGILLNRTNDFENNLKKLYEHLERLEKKSKEDTVSFYDAVTGLIKDSYIVTIKGHEYNLLNKEYVDFFPAQLQWCIDKKHYQQALILIENRTGGVLKKYNIFEINKELGMISKDCDVFGDWIKYSLCEYDDNYEYKINYPFEKYQEHFNKMEILKFEKLDYEEIENKMESIVKKETINDPPNKYNPKFKKKGKFIFKKKLYDIPVSEAILNDKEALKKLYILLYLYNGIKKYRNTVAHPNVKQKSGVKDLSAEEVEKWIQLYINCLVEFLMAYGKKKNDCMFINLSNHNSNTWSNKQLAEAKKYGEIVDMKFPLIDPCLTKKEVEELALSYLKKIKKLEPTCVMCQGEFCFAYEMINLLKRENIKVVAACSERKTVEKQTENGSEKTSIFDFVQFREY